MNTWLINHKISQNCSILYLLISVLFTHFFSSSWNWWFLLDFKILFLSKSWRSCFAQSMLIILHFSTIIERSTRKTPPLALSVSYLWKFLVILASKNLPHVHVHVSLETTSEKATCPSFWDFIHVCLSSLSISFRVHWSTIISFMCFWFCW